MDWLELIVGALLGGAVGALVDRLVVRTNSRRAEQGRAEEESRRRLMSVIQRYQAQVATAKLPSTPRSAMDPDPLSFDARLAFAREVEAELAYMGARAQHVMRGYLDQTVGPVRARMGRRIAYLPPEQDTRMTYAEVMMQVANDMSEAEVNDRGLIGAASEAASPQQEQAARDLAAGKLSEMERALRGLA